MTKPKAQSCLKCGHYVKNYNRKIKLVTGWCFARAGTTDEEFYGARVTVGVVSINAARAVTGHCGPAAALFVEEKR